MTTTTRKSYVYMYVYIYSIRDETLQLYENVYTKGIQTIYRSRYTIIKLFFKHSANTAWLVEALCYMPKDCGFDSRLGK
jgi:hypothetical protein